MYETEVMVDLFNFFVILVFLWILFILTKYLNTLFCWFLLVFLLLCGCKKFLMVAFQLNITNSFQKKQFKPQDTLESIKITNSGVSFP